MTLASARKKALGRQGRREALIFYLFIAPWLIGFLAFTIGPIVASLVLSFNDYSIVVPPNFVGLKNYSGLFTEDALFAKSLYNTGYYVLFFVPLQVVLSLGLAMLLNQDVRGVAVYRTLFYIPSIVPAVANSILWIWILQPQWGLLNFGLKFIGIKGPL